MDFTSTVILNPEINHVLPTYEYKKIKLDKIQTFSEGFFHTLQVTPKWRESERPRKEFPGSNQNNIRALNQLAVVWGDPPLEMIDHDFVHETIAQLQEDTNNSNATYNRHIATIKKVLRVCARSKYISGVPEISFLEKDAKRRPTYWRKDQVIRLQQIARERGDDTLAQAMEMSAYTGLRQAELLRLRVWDVDFHNNVLLVGGTPESRTKGRNYREVPINKKLMPILEYRASSGRPYDGLLFDEYRNKYELHRNWDTVRYRYSREDRTVYKIQVGDKTKWSHQWKCFRNSYITWALDQGTPLMTVKKWAGHKTVSITEGYYAQNDANDQEEAQKM